ncbi:MAG: NPCBM/NEW2 domain-containing protein [Paludibacteraceae bacterium]|nr:NPCBM/NEW2 domain-containing protein [Paludibacteraceae bacterium]
MKKRFLVAIVGLLCVLALEAQTYLVDVYKPTAENRIRVSSSKSDDLKTISYIYRTNGGFSIAGDAHGLIGGDNHGWCTYKIGGKYSKMSFWVGSAFVNAGTGPLNKSVLTIWADGVRIYDQPIFHADPPRFVTLDIEGVDELQFKVIIGEIDLTLGQIQLWKEGVDVDKPGLKTATAVPDGKVKLVEQLVPYFTTRYVHPITDKDNVPGLDYAVESISMARHEFKNGLQFTSSEQLAGERVDYSYFWLRKKYEKLSFIVGPRDNQSSNTSAWLVIYGDKKKILYEGIVRQSDVPQQVVVDVKGQDQICFSCELRSNDFLGSITFGAVEIYAHPKGDPTVPKEGPANINKDRVSQFKSPCSLMRNILPYSVRGVAKAKNTMFTGESSYVTFSMGGEKYSEGIILTPGTTLLDDKIDAYATFDLAEEFDYISFYAGALTNRRVLDDGRLLVYADDVKILDTVIHCTWPNAYFELPIHKCRMLKFAKPSDGKNKQIFIGLGDLALYRGKPVKNRLFYHEYPEFDDEADLIDLCGRPYFHYVGRYLSSLTNFDFNDCFIPGGSQRNFFQMKDGSKIYKGVMLEANVPLPFEDISLTEAAFMFIVGAGSAMSGSDVAAYTGVSAGAGIGGQMAVARLMNNQNHGQASVVAFNPYGQYQSCTFTVANKSEYWDDMEKLVNLGKNPDRPFKLNIFADQRLVGELWLTNRMEPVTMTVPIFNCRQLMFWLEPGEYRSGQFVLYDMTVSKAPCNTPIPDTYHYEPVASTPSASPVREGVKLLDKAADILKSAVGEVAEQVTKTITEPDKAIEEAAEAAKEAKQNASDILQEVLEATPVTFTDTVRTAPVNLPPPVFVE